LDQRNDAVWIFAAATAHPPNDAGPCQCALTGITGSPVFTAGARARRSRGRSTCMAPVPGPKRRSGRRPLFCGCQYPKSRRNRQWLPGPCPHYRRGYRRSGQRSRPTLPAEHWKHLRTSNPIESTFATVRNIGRCVRRAASRIKRCPELGTDSRAGKPCGRRSATLISLCVYLRAARKTEKRRWPSVLNCRPNRISDAPRP
jgi:hypothetical protein